MFTDVCRYTQKRNVNDALFDCYFQVRERLEIIFDRMDQNNDGTVTYGQAMKFLMLSKRDMHKCEVCVGSKNYSHD